MKYTFKLPFVQPTETGGTEEMIVIAHRIFLTQAEHKALQSFDAAVETTGVSVPVWIKNNETNEPGRELFCTYKIITAEKPEKKILPTPAGWWIYLLRAQARALDEAEFLAMSYHDLLTINDITYPVIHQIVLSGIADLERTMHCDHFDQTCSK